MLPSIDEQEEAEAEIKEILTEDEEAGEAGEQPEDMENNLGLTMTETDELEDETEGEGGLFYGSYINRLPEAMMDEEASEAAFLARYSEEYGGEDEDIPLENEG